jgi:hypothetical protein
MKTFSSLTFQELSAYNPFGYKFHSKPEQIEILETEAKNVAKEIANGLKKF